MKIVKLKDNIAFMEYDKKTDLTEFEVVEFSDKNKTSAILLSANEQGGYFAILSEEHSLKVGDLAKPTKRTFSIDIPKNPIGKVFSFEGKQIEVGKELKGQGESKPIYELTKAYTNVGIEPEILGIDSRGLVNRPLRTGVTLIDSTIPIGKGQRELIVGDRQTGKTAMAIDAIINQKGQNVICIYNMIGGKTQDIVAIYEQLKNAGALSYSMIIVSTSSDSAIKLWLSPYVATTFAEAFRNEGKDVLIVYDNLTTHAKAYRSFNLLMGTHPGREAYPGDVFYIHSRLLERAGQFNEKFKNGSITALPIVQTEKGNISAYIPTNIISITDGQIFTSAEMFNKNVRPAVNINVSVSRVGGHAQTKYMKDASGSLKSLIAQYSTIKSTLSSESALSPEKKSIYKQGQIITEIFRQKNGEPYNYELEWVFLLLMKCGFMDDFELSDIGILKYALVDFVKKSTTASRFLLHLEKMKSDEKYKKAIMEHFAKLIFGPFVKWVWISIYGKDEEKTSLYKIKYLKYETINFADINLNRQEYQIYSAVDESDVNFVKKEDQRVLKTETSDKQVSDPNTKSETKQLSTSESIIEPHPVQNKQVKPDNTLVGEKVKIVLSKTSLEKKPAVSSATMPLPDQSKVQKDAAPKVEAVIKDKNPKVAATKVAPKKVIKKEQVKSVNGGKK